MPDPSREFTFRQKAIQNEGGWCSGISVELANRAIEAVGGGIPTPDSAYDVFEAECDRVARDMPAPDLDRFKRMQRRADGGGCFGVMPGGSSNQFVYNFAGCGIAVVNLNVDKSTTIWTYGAWFQWRMAPMFFASMNHAGVVVWDPKRLFVFDPNVGGSVWTMPGWSLSSIVRYSVPARIDEALEYMYENDPQNRHRRSRVRSAAVMKSGSKSAARSRVLTV